MNIFNRKPKPVLPEYRVLKYTRVDGTVYFKTEILYMGWYGPLWSNSKEHDTLKGAKQDIRDYKNHLTISAEQVYSE
jgi:hypothetical protein